MTGRNRRPGYPPDCTARGDRRPRDPFAPGGRASRKGCPMPSWRGGRGAGAAGRPVGASLAADLYGRPGHRSAYLPHQPGCHKRPKAAPTVGLRSLVSDALPNRVAT